MLFLDLGRISVLSEQVNKKVDELHHVADLIRRVSQLIEDQDLTNVEIQDIFSRGQMDSKSWLVEVCNEKKLDLRNVFLCGGWLATLVLHPGFRFNKLRNFDLDPQCKAIADKLHRSLIGDDWK